MKVKALPSKLKSDSLSVHDEPTRNSAGRSWKQDAIRHQLQMTLALMGSSQEETEPRKTTHSETNAILSLILFEICIPPKFAQG